MSLNFGLFASVAFLFTSFHGAVSNQLYLQPEKTEYSFFTGEDFVITCLTPGDSDTTLTWVGTDENPITASEGRIHIQPTNGPDRGLGLVIQNVQKDDAGQYVCSDDRESVTLDLLVYKAISFGDTETVQHAAEGGDAAIICNARADSELPISMSYANGTAIPKSDRIKTNSNGMQIFNVSRHDAGTYKCTALLATTAVSQLKTIDISFHVWYMPEFFEDMESIVYASTGSTANLSCVVFADPAPRFQWMRNGNAIHNSSDYVIFNYGTSSILQLPGVDESRLGDYLCRASNEMGTEERTIKLQEGNKPVAPKLGVISEGKGTLTLDLTAQNEDDNELRVSGFKVEYTLASATWDQATSQEFRKGEQYILNNVSYNTEYLLRAAALNAAGYGNYSMAITHKTSALEGVPVVSDKATMATTSVMLVVLGSCILWVSY